MKLLFGNNLSTSMKAVKKIDQIRASVAAPTGGGNNKHNPRDKHPFLGMHKQNHKHTGGYQKKSFPPWGGGGKHSLPHQQQQLPSVEVISLPKVSETLDVKSDRCIKV